MPQFRWIDLLLGLLVLLPLFFCDCISKPLNGYKFPVYTTESCPRNQTEWNKRSSAINCTESNGYLCLPSEDLTELFEFCYFEYQIPIAKGLCMFLRKRDSFIDDYSCRNFVKGCPKSTYRIYEAYKYRSCVSIGNGCFLDDPTCVRTTASVETLENTKHERNDWVWIITLLGVIVLVFIPIVMYRIKIKANSFNVDVNVCDEEGFSPLYKACFSGHERTVNTPFSAACRNGHNSIVKLLFNKDIDVNVCDEDGFSPLYSACFRGHESTVNFLIDNGADVNLCTKKGTSPFSVACKNGYDSIVRLLLNNGADVNLCTKEGTSPFFVACENDHDSIVRLLLNNGADVNLCTKEGTSPFFVACKNGHDSIVRLLLDNGADVNLRTKKGTSPFFVACKNGHDSIVRLLLDNGADDKLCTKDGDTPFSAACRNGHNSIAKLLLNKRVQK